MRKEQRTSSSKNNKPFKPVFRHASNGSWLIVLVPWALLCGVKHVDKISSTYLTVSTIGAGLLISSLWTISTSLKRYFHYDSPQIALNFIFSSAVTTVLLIMIQNLGLVHSACAAILSIGSYLYILKTLTYSCPKTFTYGEVVIVSQSLILYLAFFILNTVSSLSERSNNCEKISTYILQCGYFTAFIIVILAYFYRRQMQQLKIFASVVCSLFVTFAVGLPYLVLRVNSILWILELMNDLISISLMVYWGLCCAFCIYCLWKQTVVNTQASSASRKNFHFAILFVLIPGLALKPCLTYVASGVGFAILVVVEVIRKLRMSEFSKKLQSCFDVFKDEKDEGSFALTPLCLMVGCVSPFWIYPISFQKTIPLPVLSGILSIAVGDTAASICGTSFGRIRWPGTRKTVEGTAGCIVSQVLVILSLAMLGIVQTLDNVAIYQSLFVIIITSLTEAITDQIDNLVLPLVSYILFMLFFY